MTTTPRLRTMNNNLLGMKEKMDQLCLLPKYGASSSVMAFSILKGIGDSDESDEVKSKLIDVLYRENKKEIQKEKEKKKKMILKEKITKEMEDSYKNSTKMSEITCQKKIIESLSSSTASNFIQLLPGEGTEFAIRIDRQGLNFIVMLYGSYVKNLENSMNVSDRELVPRVFRERYKEYIYDGFQMKWDLETNLLLDPDDEEIMGEMKEDERGVLFPFIFEDGDSDSESEDEGEEDE